VSMVSVRRGLTHDHSLDDGQELEGKRLAIGSLGSAPKVHIPGNFMKRVQAQVGLAA
jgi:hypothetical protein